jgi:hypothetical protein
VVAITTNRRAPSFLGVSHMPDAQNQAQRYRDVAEEYRRLASSASTEMRQRYLRMAEHYSRLAEAEELSAQARKNGD